MHKLSTIQNTANDGTLLLFNKASKWFNDILKYWAAHTPDEFYGGFYGRINDENDIDSYADKGAVLNARILWTFSAACRTTNNDEWIDLAKRAKDYLNRYFMDAEYGGLYWAVDYKGEPKVTKKQVYAIAFWLYGLSEYYRVTTEPAVLNQCKEIYKLLEHHAFDKKYGGYMEAFGREWNEIREVRLSEKDANEQKSMNTLLHVLEAYTNLYRVWPNKELAKSIRLLMQNFIDYVIDPMTFHLRLFFTEKWKPMHTQTISYGHDIEASWLLLEAAEVLDDEDLIKRFKQMAVSMANATLEGIDAKDGGLWYEQEDGVIIREKHWWPQAEAMVGFINAWQISGEEKFLEATKGVINFAERCIINHENGEWYWGINADGKPMQGMDKVGLWKCPYHNGRACMELMKRLEPVFC